MAIHEHTTAPHRRAVFTTICATAAAVVAGITAPAAGAAVADPTPALVDEYFRAYRKLLELTARQVWRSTLPSGSGGGP